MRKLYFLLFTIVILIGCGKSGPEEYEVTGKVSFRGRNLPLGSVVFVPKKGKACAGEIAESGQYHLKAPPGQYRVQISAVKKPPGGRPDPSVEGGMVYPPGARPTPLVPIRYNNFTTSQLSATVKASEENTIDFNLQ